MIGTTTKPHMTLEQFMAHARGIEFQKMADGVIRTPGYRECPVCAVANKVLGEKKYRLSHIPAAHAIGLRVDLSAMIAVCADFAQASISGDYHNVRTQLEGFCK